MTQYLSKILDWKKADITNAFDELTLWSAPFGLMLMENVPLQHIKNYLDVGCATGFPLLDLSQKLGQKCNAYGVDPWKAATERLQVKIDALKLNNIKIIEGDASKIPCIDNLFDLITSNLGINNFEDPLAVLKECCRVLKPDGSLCITSNITGTFDEFYKIFQETLQQTGLSKYEPKLEEHIKHRGNEDSMINLLHDSGFKIVKSIESETTMRFKDGTAFLNHSFTIIGFIDSWRNMFELEDEKLLFFEQFEKNLNAYASENGELRLSVPMIYFECTC